MTWVQIASNLVLALTLIAVWWQARATAHQARITSAAAGESALRAAMTHLLAVTQPWLERPELRDYFYEPRSWPPDPRERSRLQTLAEMWADCISTALDATASVEAFKAYETAWHSYASFMLERSFVLRTVIMEHHDWWPRLASVAAAVTPVPLEDVARAQEPCAATGHSRNTGLRRRQVWRKLRRLTTGWSAR